MTELRRGNVSGRFWQEAAKSKTDCLVLFKKGTGRRVEQAKQEFSQGECSQIKGYKVIECTDIHLDYANESLAYVATEIYEIFFLLKNNKIIIDYINLHLICQKYSM